VVVIVEFCQWDFYYVWYLCFVNGISTMGGTYVDCVSKKIATHLMAIVKKHHKNVKLSLNNIKSQLWIFVNVVVQNSTFDSQTKTRLTTHPKSFGLKHNLFDGFLKRVYDQFILVNFVSLGCEPWLCHCYQIFLQLKSKK
jgi:DNA gyrase/topoisomerase IV subunit B